jgi:hypothetical protein
MAEWAFFASASDLSPHLDMTTGLQLVRQLQPRVRIAEECLRSSAKRRWVRRHIAPSSVGHDEHFGNGGLVNVREFEKPKFAST